MFAKSRPIGIPQCHRDGLSRVLRIDIGDADTANWRRPTLPHHNRAWRAMDGGAATVPVTVSVCAGKLALLPPFELAGISVIVSVKLPAVPVLNVMVSGPCRPGLVPPRRTR